MNPTNAVAVLDANVLYPITLTDLLLRLAGARLFVPRWSEAIQDEWVRNLTADRPDLSPARIAHRRRCMETAFPRAAVAGYESLVSTIRLPDPDDRHVLAAAVHGGAKLLVTFNLADFPEATTQLYGVTAVHPDAFVAPLLASNRTEAAAVLATWAIPAQLETLARLGLPDTAAVCRELLTGG